MSVFERAYEEQKSFLEELDRARSAADTILAEPDSGPWAYGELLTRICEVGNVSHDSARCVEDELISDRRLRSLGHRVSRFV